MYNFHLKGHPKIKGGACKMTANHRSRREKYDDLVLNYNFPHIGKREPDLPAPSLEDIRDSEKGHYFSTEKKDR